MHTVTYRWGHWVSIGDPVRLRPDPAKTSGSTTQLHFAFFHKKPRASLSLSDDQLIENETTGFYPLNPPLLRGTHQQLGGDSGVTSGDFSESRHLPHHHHHHNQPHHHQLDHLDSMSDGGFSELGTLFRTWFYVDRIKSFFALWIRIQAFHKFYQKKGYFFVTNLQ